MGGIRPVAGWSLVSVQLTTAILALRNYRALPKPEVDGEAGHEERVSVIIPARDEAERLPQLLESLRHLRLKPLEVIVANDSSSDQTGDIARQFGCRVVEVGAIPEGWTGKCRACQLGSLEATGDWLLFTDADTVHGVCSLDGAIEIALSTNAGLVSMLARQNCSSFWERLVLPYAYAGYFVAAWSPNRGKGRAIANGQYMLFRRSTYWSIGGHESVRDSLIDDAAIARAVQRGGRSVVLCRGEELLQVHMYEDLRGLWEGFSKNVFRFVLDSPVAGAATALSGIAMAASVPAAFRARDRSLRFALLGVPAIGLAPWLKLFGVPLRYALLHPLTAQVFQLLALDSIRRTVLPGRTVWRGRRY
jgi:chlorobactene glucosyltransferase